MPVSDYARDLNLLKAAAQEAGRIASKFAQGSPEVWDKPDGAGPVTEADLAVNKMLEAELQAARPDYGWLSEETPPHNKRLGCERVFIIDPIDGTRSFIEGSNTWAHSLAIAERGRIVAGVVFLPQRDLLYTAAYGLGAKLNGAQIKPSRKSDMATASVLAARPTMDPKHWSDLPPEFARSHRSSLAYRLALVADGQFDAMLTLRATWEWDIAAGTILLQEAGATVTDKSGAPLVFNNADPRLPGVVTANVALHGQLLSALR
ncbi:inositol monophosphatase family protein [Cognatishimia maritima]|uniref:Myo-inositol-1(Or 4)-monophosphatase n=1 Tax=Cognatishimia maritima TaxID=870908 RepID=A0A1M5T1I1_9RHOB|nr:3'(2'),5'-bisphosphate nucleotidase CysQ [Cognatishimia maritima]SHH44516.1 myo-inositol-1(or 4)-monophosphatase [Cognatishimia maritima]